MRQAEDLKLEETNYWEKIDCSWKAFKRLNSKNPKANQNYKSSLRPTQSFIFELGGMILEVESNPDRI